MAAAAVEVRTILSRCFERTAIVVDRATCSLRRSYGYCIVAVSVVSRRSSMLVLMEQATDYCCT